MAFTHTVNMDWAGGARTLASSKQYSGSAQESIEETVPDSTTDLQVNVAIDVSAVKSIYILSTKNITLETNNGTTPGNTIALKANVPYIFNADMDSYFTNLLTTDVTALFLTNASGASATFYLECVYDATP